MIRSLTTEELPLCPPLGQEFFATGAFPGKLIPEVFVRRWTEILNAGIGSIHGLFAGDRLLGIIGGILFRDPNDDALVASEMFWFVPREHRGTLGSLRLVDAYESWAKNMGAERLTMIHLEALAPAALEKLYLRKGYTKVESHYIKTF